MSEVKYISSAHNLMTMRAAVNAAIEMLGGDAKIELDSQNRIIIFGDGQRYAIDISARK